MRRNWLLLILLVLSFFMLYEFFNNSFSVFILVIGIIALLISNGTNKKNHNIYKIIGLGSMALAILSSRVVLFMLVVFLILLLGQFPELSQTAKNALKKNQDAKEDNDFIMVDFNKATSNEAKVNRNKWFGLNKETTETIYSWSDVNFTKLAGNTIFDLGNTILPKEQNIILINKGFGKTKILVPEGIAISLNFSLLLGEIHIGEDRLVLKNETFKWQSDDYKVSPRKIKVVGNALIGEVEVVFL